MERRWLAVIIGTLSVYLLVHAGFLGWGLYEFFTPLGQEPLAVQGLTESEIELRNALVGTFTVFAAFGVLTAISTVGVVLKARWTQALWIAVSASIVGAVLYATLIWEAAWTSYLYELVMVAISSWYMWTIARKERREV